jgi:tetratricopeptide (TPR) repeat protein
MADLVLAESRGPHTAEARLGEAIAAYRAGRLDDVDAFCSRIPKEAPEHLPGLQLLAAVCGQRGEPRRGIELMEELLRTRPDSVDGHIELAKLLRLDGRTSDAIAALERAIVLQPKSAAAHNDLGLVHLAQGDADQAVKCFCRAVEANPALAIAHYNMGLALEHERRRREAIAAFREAVRIDPDFAGAHAKLGSLLLAESERVEALASLRRAAVAKPGSVLALLSEARALMEENRAEAARELASRALRLEPHNGDAECLLGTILMQQGRFREAALHLELALTVNHRQITAYYELVNLKRLTEADRPLLTQMEWTLQQCGLADDERIDLHFALGKAHDDLREYEKAISHFDHANRLKRKGMPFNRKRHAEVVDGMIAGFTGDFLQRNGKLGSDWEAPVLILGMPRSGTTLVEQILSCHPEVAAGGELAFWGERTPSFRVAGSGDIDPAWIEETRRDYRALLAGISPTARRVTDKWPHNFHFIGLVHSVFPRARIIHCRRHPVDTCLSIYFQNFARRMDFAHHRGDLVAFYRQYLKLMRHWRSVLSENCLLEIQYEDLVAERHAVTRKMIEFCGLDWSEACLYSERNQRNVRTASVWQARQPVYGTSVARWRRYEPWLGQLRELLSEAAL